jgi:hypothetical protein
VLWPEMDAAFVKGAGGAAGRRAPLVVVIAAGGSAARIGPQSAYAPSALGPAVAAREPPMAGWLVTTLALKWFTANPIKRGVSGFGGRGGLWPAESRRNAAVAGGHCRKVFCRTADIGLGERQSGLLSHAAARLARCQGDALTPRVRTTILYRVFSSW